MTGHCIVFEAIGKTVLESFEVPQPRPGQVLVASAYSVISAGIERANLLGLPNTSQSFPHYPGYCGIGRILAQPSGHSSCQIGRQST